MPSSRTAQPLNFLLCLSLLTGSTSVSVEHSHDRGHVPHAHGFGFTCAGDCSATAATRGTSRRHCHRLLLGVEFYGGQSAGSAAPPAAGESRDAEASLGVTPAVSAAPACPVDPSSSPAGLAAIPGRGLPAGGRQSGLRPLPPPYSALCDRARGERSGVLLT